MIDVDNFEWTKKDFISIMGCTKKIGITKEEMDYLHELAKAFDPDIPDCNVHPKFHYARKNRSTLLKNKTMASLFWEPSTRTRLSFHQSIKEQHGSVNGFSVGTGSSESKGETIYDTIKMVEYWADVIVMRTKTEGAAKRASEITNKPVVNAGDGSHQHPSQTALDGYTVKKHYGTMENLVYTLAGDLKYGRTNKSWLDEIIRNNPKKVNLISHPLVSIPEDYIDDLKNAGIDFAVYHEKKALIKCINESDVIYISRPQDERFIGIDPKEKDEVLDFIVIKKDMLAGIKINYDIKPIRPIFLHPLPRKNEIHISVDSTPFAKYFQQAAHGIPVRKGILALTMGVIK